MILIFGKTGQVATELQRLSGVVALGRADADLSDPKACADVIKSRAPNAVINAAAYTAVDRAEEEEALATLINGDAPTAMGQVCAEMGIPLVQDLPITFLPERAKRLGVPMIQQRHRMPMVAVNWREKLVSATVEPFTQ